MSVAERLLALIGGRENVVSLTRCWARLRFELRDRSLVDDVGVAALPEVAIAIDQRRQYQVALRSGLLETFDELTALLES